MDPRRRKELARVGLVALAVEVAAAALLERRHLRQIARDPEQEVLRQPAEGRRVGVRSADGTQLHAEVFGPEEGQTVVLAHGWTESLQYWTYEIEDLVRRGLRVVAFDLRGHGQSEPASEGDYSVERFGEDVAAVLDAVLEPDQRAVLAGHSLGAMSIVAWAADHDVPARASAVALINTGVGELVAETLLVPVPVLAKVINETIGGARFMSSRTPVPKFSTPISHAILRYAAFGPAATPAQIAFYERMLVACPPEVRADVGISLSELDLREALPRITVPTLVIAGDKDKLTPPAHAQRIVDALPHLHAHIVLEQTGHMSPLERPRAVSDALVELAELVAHEPPVPA